MQKVCARWVPRSLTDYHKTVRKEVCSDLLSHYKADGESFLSRIVNGDGTWIQNFEPETKRQSIKWHHPTSPRRNFKVTPSAGKVMATFLGCRRGDFGNVNKIDVTQQIVVKERLYCCPHNRFRLFKRSSSGLTN
jgi:hypothetical protein